VSGKSSETQTRPVLSLQMASLIVQKGFGVNFTNYRSIPGIPTLVASTTGLVCILESTHDIYIYTYIIIQEYYYSY
jgi:hypothetical protein